MNIGDFKTNFTLSEIIFVRQISVDINMKNSIKNVYL